jgi:hypothetical protein
MNRSLSSIFLWVVATILLSTPIVASGDDLVFKATYDVWISPNYDAPPVTPPHTPFHSCLTMSHFGGTSWTMELDSCPPAGPAWVNPGTIQAFGGRVCHTVHVIGWFINSAAFPWAPKDVIGGIMGSTELRGTWGFEGVRNEECKP